MRKLLAMFTVLTGTLLSPRGEATDIIQTTCSVGTENGTYVGRALFIETPNGNLKGFCNGDLVSGSDVETATSLSIFIGTAFGLLVCDATLTPGGRANLNCSD